MQAKIPAFFEIKFLPILNKTGIVKSEKSKDKLRTATGLIPNSFSQKCKIKKCNGGLFSCLNN